LKGASIKTRACCAFRVSSFGVKEAAFCSNEVMVVGEGGPEWFRQISDEAFTEESEREENNTTR
jgi:hypothetical protein